MSVLHSKRDIKTSTFWVTLYSCQQLVDVLTYARALRLFTYRISTLMLLYIPAYFTCLQQFPIKNVYKDVITFKLDIILSRLVNKHYLFFFNNSSLLIQLILFYRVMFAF